MFETSNRRKTFFLQKQKSEKAHVIQPFNAEMKSLRSTLPDEIFFTGEFASWTVHFVNICANNQQIQQLFIQFINYVW
jgi:hypothetical protein